MSLRRKWLAIALATVVMTISYWAILFARALGSAEGTSDSGAPFAFGMMLVPFTFITLAFASRQRDAPWAVVKAMGLFAVFGLPLGLVNVVLGLVLGFGLGGVVALRREEVHRWQLRVIAVLAAVLYTLVVLQLAPPMGIFTGSVVPFVAAGIADQVSEGRAADRQSGDPAAGDTAPV